MFLRGMGSAQTQRTGAGLTVLLDDMRQFVFEGLLIPLVASGVNAFAEKDIGTDRERTGIQRLTEGIGFRVIVNTDIAHIAAEFTGILLILFGSETGARTAFGLNSLRYGIRQHTALRSVHIAQFTADCPCFGSCLFLLLILVHFLEFAHHSPSLSGQRLPLVIVKFHYAIRWIQLRLGVLFR